jgi:hypothetical protein
LKNKKEILFVTTIFTIVFFGIFLTNGFAATIDEASSSIDTNVSFSSYHSRFDIQGDFVYEDAAGTTDYAIFMAIENWFWTTGFSTRTYSYLYVSAHYYYVYDSGEGNYDTWAPIDPNLVSWGGSYVWNPNGQDWEWTVSATDYYCNGNEEDTTSSVTKSYDNTGADDGIWRKLGYFYTSKSGNRHKYDALLKLQIDNAKGEEYVDGRRYFHPDDGWYTETISEIRVKLYVKFYYYDILGWHLDSTHTHYLGDGSGTGDLSTIPLVEGTVDGLS